MPEKLRIAVAQINCTVGDIDGNSQKIVDYISRSKNLGADITVFPELAITGYPPEDLLLKKSFIDDNLSAIKKIAKSVNETIAIIGFADRQDTALYNAAAIVYAGEIRGIYHKMCLPNYGVFDEKRYFKTGSSPAVFRAGRFVFGVNICEDIWHKDGPVAAQASAAGLIININASPYHAGKARNREDVIINLAKEKKVNIVYANLVGGQDELVFDGQSMYVDNGGRVLLRAMAFEEDMLVADMTVPQDIVVPKDVIVVTDSLLEKSRPQLPRRETESLETNREIYRALTLGLKDYVLKNGFTKVLVGMSGGIDSSLVATIAADALGKENVIGIFMPTRYTSPASEADAKKLAGNLGITFTSIPIDHIYKIYLMSLESHFAGRSRDIAEENLQARIRGNLLMALSNKFGYLVLTTGNKSEMSTGYATLYGDMAGGLAVIKDVPKTLIYKLARFRNSQRETIPESILKKEPTAELRPDQKDRDTLPPYDVLDPILKAYVEEDRSGAEIVSMGFDKATVAGVISMVDRSEYKRRQSPPGIKITPKAFGKDRRMPITNKCRII